MTDRCAHSMMPGFCTHRACPNYDGGRPKTRWVDRSTVKCHRCKQRCPRGEARRIKQGESRFECSSCSPCEFCGDSRRQSGKCYCVQCGDKYGAPKPCIHGCGTTLSMHEYEGIVAYMQRESCIPCARKRSNLAMRLARA